MPNAYHARFHYSNQAGTALPIRAAGVRLFLYGFRVTRTPSRVYRGTGLLYAVRNGTFAWAAANVEQQATVALG